MPERNRNKKLVPQATRKSVDTIVGERIKPLLDSFVPGLIYYSVSTVTKLSDELMVAITLHWDLADIGIDATDLTPRTSLVMVLSPLNPPREEQMARQEEGKKEEDHIFANVALDLSIRLKPLIQESGLNTVILHEYNPTFDLADLGQEERYSGLRVVLHGTITRAQLGLRPIEEEIQELIEPTRERWERFSQSRHGKRSQPVEVDLARAVIGGYQGEHGEKPISIESGTREGQVVWTQDSGLVNPCQFGDQGGAHSCYCSHDNGPRKCHYSWYTGGKEPDWTCPIFRINPLWQEVSDDFYENRAIAIEVARRLGLVGTEDCELGAAPVAG